MSTVASQVTRKMVLTQDRFQTAEYTRTEYRVVPAEGVTFEEVLQPSYWTHVAHLLKVGDHIEVFPDTQEYWAELLVIGVERLAVDVQTITKMDVRTGQLPENPATSNFEVVWKGPQHKWCVIRKGENGGYVKRGLPNKVQANKELEAYLQALTR